MKTISPEESRQLFPDQRPVITRADDGAERFMEPHSIQQRYHEHFK